MSLELYLKLNRSESIAELAKAIVAAQLEMKPAKKDSSNPFYHSKYADLPAVWESIEPFRKHGIAIVQRPCQANEGYVKLETILLHTSGEWYSSFIETRIVKDDPQGVGSAITYMRRYSLGCMTGAVTEEDDDGNSASHGPKATPFQQKQTAQAKINELRTQPAAPTVDAAALADDPAAGYRHTLRQVDGTNQAINTWWETVPDTLRQDLYQDYTAALRSAAKGRKK